MDILLTGATGYIGKAVLVRLLAVGHDVTAVVRSEASAAAVEEAGARPLAGDLFDSRWLRGRLETVQGAVHVAAGSDADDADLNDSVVDAAIEAFEGTDKPFVHTGGIWVYGDNDAITEESRLQAPAITAWREAAEQRLLTSGIRGSVVRPGIVYGRGGGIPAMLAAGPRDDAGALLLIGSGDQHWATVHVDDLADLYLHVLDASPGGEVYVGAGGGNPTVRELGEALGPVVPGSGDEAARRFGPAFAEALLLDQQATGEKARGLGWQPTSPSLVELLAAGYPADR